MVPTTSASAKKKTEKPVVPKRARALSLNEIRCGLGGCSYTAKTDKTVERHRLKVHEVTPNRSLMDQSVSASFLDDTNFQFGATVVDGSLEHKTSKEFYSDMSKVKQSTQLVEGDNDQSRRRKRSDDDEGEDKRQKLELSRPRPPPTVAPSQGTIERQILIDDVMGMLANQDKVEELDTSKSLLEEGVESQGADLDSTKSQDSESVLMVTARDTDQAEGSESRVEDNPDSLELNFTRGEDPLLAENRGLQEELQLRTQSLHETQAQVANLKSKAANAVRFKEHLEAEITAKDNEINKLTGVIKALKTTLENKPVSEDTKDKKINQLKNKVSGLEKALDESRAETKRVREVAETQRSITAGFEVTQRDHLAQIASLKRKTLCEDEDCTSDKVCGRSHAKKPENLGQCTYFNFGRCTKVGCKFKHDEAAKLKFHEEKKREKEQREKEEKEDEKEKGKEKAKEGEKKKTEKSDEDKKREKREKEKLKKKRKRELKKAETKDCEKPMDVDDSVTNSSSVSADPAKESKRAKVEKPPPPAPEAPTAPPPNPTHNIYSHPPPPIPTHSRPTLPPHLQSFPPPFQHSLPPTFNFSQHNSLQAAAASTTPYPGPHGAPAAASGPFQWQQEASNHFLQQEAVQAQSFTRKMKLEKLRSEIANVQGRIMAAHSQPTGSEELTQLVMHESALKQRMYEATYL